MTSDEILLALRLVAMGRPAHDEVKRLAEFLGEKPASEPLPAFPTSEQVEAAQEAKPKRAKKAD